MCQLKWSPEMEIGIIELDMQHRTLLDIIGMLDDIVKEESYGKSGKRILREFDRYVRYHFKTEEDMMIKYQYEDLEHIAHHNAILNRLDNLMSHDCDHECLKGVVAVSLRVFDGQQKFDNKFAAYMQSLDKEEKAGMV